MEIQDVFVDTALQYTNSVKALACWKEIEGQYCKKGRHYHTVDHLETLMSELLPHKHSFANWDTIVFAIVYHDSIYNPIKSDNEEKSAALAVKRLSEINIPQSEINRCKQLILATKKHEPTDDEINLFTDADLSILGAKPDRYKQYARGIRKEYSMFPDFLYYPGRRKVLNHFLAMPAIYKTAPFREKYEELARVNIKTELQALT